jgi:hypothetical protein
MTNAAQTSETDWLQIIRGEFQDFPGLHLTKPQFQRLWGLDPPTCDVLLTTLINGHFLERTSNGTYARADSGR